MPDREMLMSGLYICADDNEVCKGCPYQNNQNTFECITHLSKDALTYIKALEKEMRELQHAPSYITYRQQKRDVNLEQGIMQEALND